MRSLHGDETLRPSGCADSTLQLPLLPKRSVLTTSTSATSNSMEIAAAAARAAAMAVQAPFEAVRTHLPTVTWHDVGITKPAMEHSGLRHAAGGSEVRACASTCNALCAQLFDEARAQLQQRTAAARGRVTAMQWLRSACGRMTHSATRTRPRAAAITYGDQRIRRCKHSVHA
jgi:hypothetical protein